MFIPLVSNQNGAELVSGCYRYTMCGGAYVALVLARTWEYTRDDDLMRVKLFPLIYEINKFYVNNMLHKKEDGKYHLDPTVPPEIFYFTSDETATLAMLRTSLRVGLEFAKLSGLSDSETEKWEDVLAKYPDIAKRSCGSWWGGPDVPEDHFSFGTHILYPFFPAEEYVSDRDREDAEATLRYIEKSAVERCYAGTHGWHFIHDWSWHLYYSTLAHLGGKYKDTVWEQLFEFLDYFAKPNGLFTHNSIVICPSSVSEENHDRTKGIDEVTADITNGPSWYGSGKCATPNIHSKDLTAPVIEGNSIFLLRATETLIQSFDGILRLFPGVPDDFEGSFYQLRARGGFTVSASMSGGAVSASVKAKVDSELLLNAPTSLKLSKDAELIEMHGINVYRLFLKAGEEIIVSSL